MLKITGKLVPEAKPLPASWCNILLYILSVRKCPGTFGPRLAALNESWLSLFFTIPGQEYKNRKVFWPRPRKENPSDRMFYCLGFASAVNDMQSETFE